MARGPSIDGQGGIAYERAVSRAGIPIAEPERASATAEGEDDKTHEETSPRIAPPANAHVMTIVHLSGRPPRNARPILTRVPAGR